jgi:hypothetical protein
MNKIKYLHGKGHVEKILPDDLKGSRHQKFTVKLKNKTSVLIVHNIDLCQRVHALNIGDLIEFYGVYQWNRFGGLVHWTHIDKHHGHNNGWIKHHGITYQ